MAGGWLPSPGSVGAYPDATGEAAGLIPETDGADGWTFIPTPTVTEADVMDAGRWEVVVADVPAEAVTTEDETDWLYTWVSG